MSYSCPPSVILETNRPGNKAKEYNYNSTKLAETSLHTARVENEVTSAIYISTCMVRE